MRWLPVAAALLLVACGGVDKEAYERSVRAIVAEAREAGRTPAAMRGAAAKLRALEPPEEVAGPHRDLTTAFGALADAGERGTEPPEDVIDRLLAARRAFGERRYDIGVYGPLS